MGKGKGGHFQWICPVKIGQIFIEFNLKKKRKQHTFFKLLKFIRKCQKRIPFKCKLIIKKKKYFCSNLEQKYNTLLKL